MLLDREDLLSLLQISPSTLYRRVKSGKIQAVKVGGSYRYKLTADMSDPAPAQDTSMAKSWRDMDTPERLLRVEGLLTECVGILKALKALGAEPPPKPKKNGTAAQLTLEEQGLVERQQKARRVREKSRYIAGAAIEKFNAIATLGRDRPRTFQTKGKAMKFTLARLKDGYTSEDLLLVATWANSIAISGMRPEQASSLYGRYSWGFAGDSGHNMISPYVLWNEKFEERLEEAQRWEAAQQNVKPEATYEEGWA